MPGAEAIDAGSIETSLFGWPAPSGAPTEAGAFCIIGAPADHGNVISRGAALAPAMIRRCSGAFAPPRRAGLDAGDVDATDAPDPEVMLSRVSCAIRRLSEAGLCPLLLGGDHSLSFAPIAWFQERRDLCLVWFDAHTDFSPWHGPQAHNHKQVLRRISSLPGIRRIVQIGYRGLTVGDERSLGANAEVVTTAQARTLDGPAILNLVPPHLPVYISLDIDVVDPMLAPGTSAPVPGGLSADKVGELLRALVTARDVLGIDLVEVNPALDHDDMTSQLAAGLVKVIADARGERGATAAARVGFAPTPAGVQAR